MKNLFILSIAAFAVLASIALAADPAPSKSPTVHVEDAPTIQFHTPSVFEIKSPVEHIEAAPAVQPSRPRSNRKGGVLCAAFGSIFLFGMINIRTLQDLNLAVTHALPAANAANFSGTIDTAEVNPGRVPDVELLISMPATPSLADTYAITLTLKDSADGVTFAAVADLPTVVSTGAGGVGAAAVSRQFKLPINLRRYVRLDAAVANSGGDNTAISYTLGFVF